MSCNAIIKVMNPEVVRGMGQIIEIGYPGEKVVDTFVFKLNERESAEYVRERLLLWLEQHLKANGVTFG